MSLLLKYSGNEKELHQRLGDIFTLIQERLETQDESNHMVITTFVCYILLSTHIKLEELSNAVRNVTPIGGEVIMTTGMELIEKGKKEGLEQGAKQARLEDAQKMLERGLDIALIMDITGLSKKEIEGLKK